MAAEPIEREVAKHGWEIKGLRDSIQRTDATVEDVRRDVTDIKEKRAEDTLAFAKFVTTVEVAAQAAKDAADKSVTSKQFYVGVALVVIALVGLILGAPHA